VHAGAVFANVERSERKNGACMTAAAAACLGKLKATAGKGDGAKPLPSACRFVSAVMFRKAIKEKERTVSSPLLCLMPHSAPHYLFLNA